MVSQVCLTFQDPHGMNRSGVLVGSEGMGGDKGEGGKQFAGGFLFRILRIVMGGPLGWDLLFRVQYLLPVIFRFPGTVTVS